MNIRDHPIFICGYKKSGTTLLLAMLDNHPELLVYPVESAFFKVFLPLIKERNLEEKIALARGHLIPYHSLIKQVVEQLEPADKNTEENVYAYYADMCKNMRHLIDNGGFRNDGDLLSSSVLAFGKVKGQLRTSSKAWVEKTPGNEYYADKIFQWWPDARCIHIMRSPVDNFASVSRKHPESIFPESFARAWVNSTKRGYFNQRKYGTNKYLILRYEDLVGNTDETIAKLISFLEISMNENLKMPSLCGIPWSGNSMFGDEFTGISKKPLNRGSQVFIVDKRIIGLISGSFMNKLGYPVEYNSTSRAYMHIIRNVITRIYRKFNKLEKNSPLINI